MNIDLTQKDKIEIRNLIQSEIKNINALLKHTKGVASTQILSIRKVYYLELLNRI